MKTTAVVAAYICIEVHFYDGTVCLVCSRLDVFVILLAAYVRWHHFLSMLVILFFANAPFFF